MSTLAETIWVHNRTELDATVARLVGQGAVVQNQTEDCVNLYLKKKMNVVVLVVGLLLCLVPGLAYLVWYMTADQNQAITVQIGSPPSLGGYRPDGTGHPTDTGAPALGTPPVTPAMPPVPNPAEATSAPIPPAPGEEPPPAPPPAPTPT